MSERFEIGAFMNDVKRYDCGNGGAQYCDGCYTMEENDLGDYVRWEDYDQLLRTMEYWEKLYLAEHTHWGACKWRLAIEEHNTSCQKSCGEGETEGVACGYRKYFPRRCPTCPRHDLIEVSPEGKPCLKR